jgi:hypothetical protein
LTVIVTSSCNGVQGAFDMVHLKTVMPLVNPVTVVVGLPGLVITGLPPPETLDHIPLPLVGAFPANVTVVELQSV